MRSLTLSLQDLNLNILEHYITSIQPFVPIEWATIGYTVAGVATAKGRQHEPRLTWNLTALLVEDEMNLLRAMIFRADKFRRMYRPIGITLIDGIQKYVEDAPRTRALAPGATERVIGSRVEYFGMFQVALFNLKTPKQGRFYECSWDMVEVEQSVVVA